MSRVWYWFKKTYYIEDTTSSQISRHQEAVTVIYISHIVASLLHLELLSIVIKHPEAPQRAVREVLTAILVTSGKQLLHTVIVVQKRVRQQKRIHMSLMMMDMMISIWMGITMMTDIVQTVIMQMVWMMRWMSSERIGKGRRVEFNEEVLIITSTFILH